MSSPSTERFLTTPDGTRLWLHSQGEGLPVLLCDGLGCDGFIWKYIRRDLGASCRFVHWHYRGHGLSGAPRDPEALSIDHMMDDMERVLDAAGLERAVLFGHSMGVQLTLEFALRRPERVLGVVTLCGSYGRPLDTFHDDDWLALFYPQVRKLVERHPRRAQFFWESVVKSEVAYQIATRMEVNGKVVRRADFVPYFQHIGSMNVELFVRLLGHIKEHSVEDRLAKLAAPTLVVAGERDTFTPAWLSRRMAELIPRAELLEVPGGTHVAPIEIPELVNLRIERFFERQLGDVARAPQKRAPAKARSSAARAAKAPAARRATARK